MDALNNLQSVPLGNALATIAYIIAIATVLLRWLPEPKPNSTGAYVTAYNFVHLIANLKDRIQQDDRLGKIMDLVMALLPPQVGTQATQTGVLQAGVVRAQGNSQAAPSIAGIANNLGALLLIAFVSLGLCACGVTQQQVNADACAADAIAVPLAAGVSQIVVPLAAPGAAPLEAAAVAADAPVHQAIQGDCAAKAAAMQAATDAAKLAASAPAPAPLTK